jgi:glycosyltransferase involved in cell wall biosynthesis
MEFDIVIATRNRQDVLQVSLPLMLSQDRLPERLIVADSSDDHKLTRNVVEGAVKRTGASFSLEILKCEPGICSQRNVSLKYVKAPVVFFPDDDALWFPGFAKAVTRIYERDEEELIGAVGGSESLIPPDGPAGGKAARNDEINAPVPVLIERMMNSFERLFFPDPFFLQARVYYKNRRVPEWLAEEKAVVASTITGFRMSFRSDLIKRTGFDEILGRYGLFEDHDACMGILASHCIVNAREAKVFHRRPRARRADELELGMMHILNRAYILMKHDIGGFRVRPSLMRYACYKLALYALRACNPHMRRRLVGAWRAAQAIPRICDSSREALAREYLELREKCVAG